MDKEEREPATSGFAAPDVGCTLGFWGEKPDVLQLDCAVFDPEMSRESSAVLLSWAQSGGSGASQGARQMQKPGSSCVGLTASCQES